MQLDHEWVYEKESVDFPWIIMLGMAMDHQRLSQAPSATATEEIMTQYIRGESASFQLAKEERTVPVV